MGESAWASEQLIRAAQDGDLDSLAEVVHGAHPHVRRFAARLCRSPQDAEDAAQEALIVLYRKIGTLRATAALVSWMFRIVRNECHRLLRLRGVHDRDVPVGTVASAKGEVLQRLEAVHVAQAIGALPDLQRRVLIMRDVLGHPGRTVAEALGLSTAAMKSNLHRARSSLRRGLSCETDALGETPIPRRPVSDRS